MTWWLGGQLKDKEIYDCGLLVKSKKWYESGQPKREVHYPHIYVTRKRERSRDEQNNVSCHDEADDGGDYWSSSQLMTLH